MATRIFRVCKRPWNQWSKHKFPTKTRASNTWNNTSTTQNLLSSIFEKLTKVKLWSIFFFKLTQSDLGYRSRNLKHRWISIFGSHSWMLWIIIRNDDYLNRSRLGISNQLDGLLSKDTVIYLLVMTELERENSS